MHCLQFGAQSGGNSLEIASNEMGWFQDSHGLLSMVWIHDAVHNT